MNGLALLALALAELAAQEPVSAPPRVRIGGQHTIHAVSRVVFDSAPDDPHRLATTLGFPDRVRTELSREGGRASDRSLAYRYGRSFWTLAHGSDASGAVADARREFLAHEFALRRALLLWPDGHAWSEPDEAGTRSAELALPDGRARLVATGHAGDDEATDAPPARLAMVDREGRERVRFEALVWEREQARWRPRSGRYAIDDRPVWTETFLLVDRRARLVDAWFVPPDRRDVARADVDRRIASLDLRPGLVRRRALAGEPDLAEALERARELLAKTTPPPGHRLARDLHVELDAEGRPRAVSVWMEPWSESPPAGWEAFPGGPALGRWLPVPEAARGEALAELIRSADAQAGDAPRLHLRVAERADGTVTARVHLVLRGETRR